MLDKMEFKYIELFAGIGGFRQALDRLGGKCVFASEIDKHAAKSYEVIYGEMPAGDITKIDADDIPDHDLLTAGFPCQAFSVAGKRLGFEDTRGTLFFEIARIAAVKQPKYMLLENVKGLLSHDKGKTFEVMCAVLNDLGYAIDFNVLNSKYFGVPQNRERVFIVCDRDAEHAEWVVKGTDVVAKAKRRIKSLGVRTFNFDWPEQGEVTTRLRDILEDSVDERYYLSEEKTAKLVAQLNGNHEGETDKFLIDDQGRKTKKLKPLDISPTLRREMHGNEPRVVEPQLEQYSEGAGLAYTVDANYMKGTSPGDIGKGRRTHVVEVAALTEQQVVVYSEDDDNALIECGECSTRFIGLSTKCPICNRITIGKRIFREEIRPVLTPDREEKRQDGRRFKEDGEEAFTLTAQDRHGVAIGKYPRYRIRKLTPLECWRLQGFPDEAHERVKRAGISDSQRYKQAGNAVTVNVVEAIGRRLIPMFKRKGGDQHDYQGSHLESVD